MHKAGWVVQKEWRIMGWRVCGTRDGLSITIFGHRLLILLIILVIHGIQFNQCIEAIPRQCLSQSEANHQPPLNRASIYSLQ